MAKPGKWHDFEGQGLKLRNLIPDSNSSRRHPRETEMVREIEASLTQDDINELVQLIKRGLIVADLEAGSFRIPLEGTMLRIEQPN
jgi:hypothetical protein